MMLVVDVTKGVQTQTAECLVIGEITCDLMLVVLNKIDLLPPQQKEISIEKMKKRILKTLEKTRFAGSPVVAVAAKPGGAENDGGEADGVDRLVDLLCQLVRVPERASVADPLLLSVDHCFSIRGQGTVLTGTVVQGSLSVGEVVEIAALKITRKVKSIQMFRKPIQKAIQGDRVGVCVTQLDPKQLERGIVSTPGHVTSTLLAVARVQRIPYFKGKCISGAKFHITAMHDTLLARVTFFSREPGSNEEAKSTALLDMDRDYAWEPELEQSDAKVWFVLLEMEHPLLLHPGTLLIGSKLDMDVQGTACRIAFHGHVCRAFSEADDCRHSGALRVFKCKCKEGVVERVVNEHEVIVRSLFKKESNISNFSGLKVHLSSGEQGTLLGSFGQSGKVKIQLKDGIQSDELRSLLAATGRKKRAASGDCETAHGSPVTVTLAFKRYVYDSKKKIVQT
ncbi:selenocysteine-specific elongation factor-like isoform X2 [Ornithodoros turicata]